MARRFSGRRVGVVQYYKLRREQLKKHAAKWLVLVVGWFVFCGSAFAQNRTLINFEKELVGSWVLTGVKDNKARQFVLKGIAQKSDEVFLLDADYGWVSGGKSAVSSELRQDKDGLVLHITTQPKTKIEAKRMPDGTFAGTFAPVKGDASTSAYFKKVQDVDPALMAEEHVLAPTAPSSSVPATCADFFGVWKSVWSQGSFGAILL